jgi:RsiW-degrading membrane proteinase PrsW (M82 family)
MYLLIASIAPAVIIMYIIYRHDTVKEPLSMLVKAFFGGVLSIAITLIITYPILGIELNSGAMKSFFDAFFKAGIPEEFSKWLIFYWLIRKAKDFDQYYDGILYAIFISMGFALVENILYVFENGMGTAIARSIISVPGHMLFAVPMGYYLSLSRFETGASARFHVFLSLAIPILLHGTFDFILMYSGAKGAVNSGLAVLLLLAFVIFDIFMWRYGLRKIKEHIIKDKNNLNAPV